MHRGKWVLLLALAAWSPGCSGGSAAPPEQPVAEATAAPNSQTPATAAQPRRWIARRAEISLRVEQIEDTTTRIRQAVSAMGGFVASSELVADSGRGSLQVKVPAARLDSFLEQLGQWGRITSRQESAEDVGEQVMDGQARLTNLRRQEERLRELCKAAGGVGDLLKVEKDLARVRGEIETLEGQLKRLSQRVEYSTVEVSLLGPRTVPGPPESFWRVQQTVDNAGQLVRLCLRLLLHGLIYCGALLPLLLPPWLLLRYLGRPRPQPPQE